MDIESGDEQGGWLSCYEDISKIAKQQGKRVEYIKRSVSFSF